MSKKMWNKIFKSKSSKNAKTNASKINKRCSIYEEYQQLNALLNCEKTTTPQLPQSQEKQQHGEYATLNSQAYAKQKAPTPTDNTTATTINDETPLPAIVAASNAPVAASNNKQQSTFSKMVNTLTLSKRQKETRADSGNGNAALIATKTKDKSNSECIAAATPPQINNNNNRRRNSQSQITIVVRKVACVAEAETASAADITHSIAAIDQVQSSVATIVTAPTTTTTTLQCNRNVTNQSSILHVEKYNSNSSNINNIIAPTDEPDPNVSVELIPCHICSRTFNPVTLQKHVGICEKMATKKRNVFDSSRQRREGTELAAYPLPKNYGSLAAGGCSVTAGAAAAARAERGQSPKPQQLVSPILTRKKSQDDFARSTARTSMRKRSNSTNSGARTPTTPTATSYSTVTAQFNNVTATGTASTGGGHFTRDRMRSSERSLAKRIQPPVAEQCPHCERCFGIKAYDRHVEWCKEKALQATIKQSSKAEQNVAKERLEARTKYRAPCLKTKRSINRDKYSGLTGDENEAADSPKSVNSNNIMSLSMTSSITSDRNVTIPGNINEASSYKMKHYGENNNNNNRVNSVTNTATESDVSKHARGTEDFHIIGEKLATYGKKKKKQQPKQQQQQQQKETINKNALGNVLASEYGNGTDPAASMMAADQRNVKSSKSEEMVAKQAGDTNSCEIAINANDRSDSNDLSTALALRPCGSVTSVGSAAPTAETNKYSATSITKRKLKTKQKSTINLTHIMVDQQQENIALKSPSSSVDALSTLMPNITLPQQMSQRQAIFEMPATAAATITLHTKLETNPIKSPAICRPKRKKVARQTSASAYATPLKAIPLLKESIETFGMPTRELHTARTHTDYDNKEIKVIKAPTSVRHSTPPPLARNRSFVLSGLPANYDPFLSAKRQLEELCSPLSPTEPYPLDTLHTPKTNNSLQPPSTPTTPNISTKMSTSLTLSTTTTPNSSLLASSNAQNRISNAANNNTNTNSKTPTSNFRRASSLRGPRRSPMLPSRPLFAQKHRPTIQRGLSDEGPISSNFLKPEEYDEMPVRSVCVNDFAITKSPRVVRRDTSNSNRKQGLKLNISPSCAAGAAQPMLTPTPPPLLPHSRGERLLPDAKYLLKTDSLAVFLKYENELEQLGASKSGTVAAKVEAPSLPKPTLDHSPLNTPAANLNSPVFTKELKDKSNNLSKQNSAKSIKLDSLDSTEQRVEEPPQLAVTQLPTPTAHATRLLDKQMTKPSNDTNISHNNKHSQIRLEPISKPTIPAAALTKPTTPLTKPSTPYTTSYTPGARSALPSMSTPLPAVSQPITLSAIFSDPKPQMLSYGKERKHSNSGEYIDPKLINKCDNLPVNVVGVRTLKTSAPDSSAQHIDTSSSSSECSAPASAAPVSQLSKLLPLSKAATSAHIPQQSHYSPTVMAAATSAQPNVSKPTAATPSYPLGPRNSAEGRHLLKRKMRLGRNQFLYDASPEADSCSADDEANRSSAEYEGHQFQLTDHNLQHPPLGQSLSQPAQQQTRQRPAPLQTPPAHNIPALPIFDDFDFEEFLSSFENDDEQFPLFKDCREFLLNRTSNKQRSTVTPNSNAGNSAGSSRKLAQPTTEKHQSRQSPYQYDSYQSASTNTTAFPASHTHFPFPNVLGKPLLTSSSLRSHNDPATLANKEPSLQSVAATTKYDARFYDNDNLAIPNDTEERSKREIFISIETEQNDLSRSPISPDSLRSMVGNPQAMVEVEVDACDNKFSRISDDEPLPPMSATSQLSMTHGKPFSNLQHFPNVQLNNAKNLIQKMQDDFRQMSEEVGATIRQTVAVQGTTHQRSITAGGAPRCGFDGATKNVSVDGGVDSDDMSSLDGYPISSQSSRRGVGSKLSADSAYGSLSRQRSSDMSTHRNQSRTRPSTASASTNTTMPANRTDTATQHQQHQHQQQQPHYKYTSTKSRPRQLSGSSSSGSDNSLPPIANHSHNLNPTNCNSNYQQQQQLSQLYNNSNNNHTNGNNVSSGNNNNSNCASPLSSPTGGQSTATTTTTATAAAAAAAAAVTIAALQNDANANLSHASSRSNSISSSAMSTSTGKMSKFCHECGSRFIIEHAKFCTDCGVRRIVL